MSEHRLTDAEIEEAFAYTNSLRITAALAELKERRAADLTAEEREALTWFRSVVSSGYSATVRGMMEVESQIPERLYAPFLAALDRLIAANGEGK